MKSICRTPIIIVTIFVLCLLIGLPHNEITSGNNRTVTVYPSVTSISSSDSKTLSAFQTSSTASYFAESDELNIGTAVGTWALTNTSDDLYHQINSQYIVNNLATGGGTIYQNTYASDGVYDESLSSLNSTQSVLTHSHLQSRDGIFVTISESGSGSSITSQPLTWGSEASSKVKDQPIHYLWYEDGVTGRSYPGFVSVGKQCVLHTDSCDTTGISGTITSVTLYVNYTVEFSYDGNMPIQYKKATDIGYTSTSIVPYGLDKPEEKVVKSEPIYDLAKPITVDELQKLNLRFENNGNSPLFVFFDKVWLEVTVQDSGYILNFEQKIVGVQSTAVSYEVCIFGNRSADEKINIEIFNNTAGGWDYIGQIKSTTSPTWNNITIDSTYLINGDVNIRCTDSTPDLSQSHLKIDVALVKAYAYSLDRYYSFEWTGDSAQVANISVCDVSSGNQDIHAYIRDFKNGVWVPLDFIIGTSFSNHSKILSSSPERFLYNPGNGLHEIWIRYYEVNSLSSTSLKVDYLGVNLHFSTDASSNGEWEIDTVYDIENFPFDRSDVTQLTVADSSYVTSGRVDVQIFNYTSNQWTFCFSITETTEKAHSATFSSSSSHLISSNPGNIQIRYKNSAADIITLKVDFLRVDIKYGGGGDDGTGIGGGEKTDGDGGGEGISLKTMEMLIAYPQQIEKYSDAQINVILTDNNESFVSGAKVILTIDDETEPLSLEEKEGYYTTLLATDILEEGNHTFAVSAQKSGFEDFLSSAFPIKIIVSYPFLTVVQHTTYLSEVMEDPVSLLKDPTLYIPISLIVLAAALHLTTFAPISPQKLRSICIFTPEGKIIYYRTFSKEIIDKNLTTTTLSGLIKLIKDATPSDKPIQTVDQGNFEIFLGYGRVIMIAAFVEKGTLNKRKIRKGQKEFLKSVEDKYEKFLLSWNGYLNYFFGFDQLVFDVFDIKVTKDIRKLIFDIAKTQEDLISLYMRLYDYQRSSKALWKAYDLYAKIKSTRALSTLVKWRALEKSFVLDYIRPKNALQSEVISKFFALLDFIRSPYMLKILYKIRSVIFSKNPQ